MADSDQFLNGLLVGGLLGLVGGILFAPDEGRNTRQQLRYQTEEALTQIKRQSENAAANARKAGERLDSLVDDLRQRLPETDEVASVLDEIEQEINREIES